MNTGFSGCPRAFGSREALGFAHLAPTTPTSQHYITGTTGSERQMGFEVSNVSTIAMKRQDYHHGAYWPWLFSVFAL